MGLTVRFSTSKAIARRCGGRRAELVKLVGGDLEDAARRPDRTRRIHVNKGADPSLLVVVFTGQVNEGRNRRFAFEQQTERMGCSRILLHDAENLCYLRGIRPTIEGYAALRDRIGELIDALSPQRTVFAGECLGGYAAIRMGCELNVETVHAFGPATLIDIPTMALQRQWYWLRRHGRLLMRMWRHGFDQRSSFDLRKVIQRSDGNTRYFIHAAGDNASDVRAATHLAGLPRTSILLHRGNTHIPAFHLEGQRTLPRWLRMRHDALDFSDTMTTDDDLTLLADLRELKFLNLSNTTVTDTGLQHLLPLPELEQVNLSGTSVSAGAIDAFHTVRPSMHIEI